MFVGHVGAALALKKVDSTLNAGALVFAALWLDVVLWILVIAGVEQVRVPADFSARRYQYFEFPFSHGLAATLIWSLAAFALAAGIGRPRRAATTLAIAVFSHFVLDGIEHEPELPLWGGSSPKLGLGLWNHLAMALALEIALVLAGLAIYLRSDPGSGRVRRYSLVAVVLLLTAMAVGGQWMGREAPAPKVAAISSLVTMGVLCLVLFFLDWRRSRG